MDSIYIDIDSQHRNRIENPNPYNFTINYSNNLKPKNLQDSVNPMSDAYPIKEWSWNSNPPIQIITSGHQHTKSTGGYGPNIYSSGTSPQQYRISNTSSGTGITFNMITKPTVTNNKLTAGELKICTYGSGYVPGETLKIHRDDIVVSTSATTQISHALQPILMTKDFETVSGYTGGSTFNNSTNITFTDSTNKWSCTAHGLENGNQIYFIKAGDRPYVGSTSGHPQTFFLYHTYYIVNKETNAFQLSLTRGGSVLEGNGSDSSSEWEAKKVSTPGPYATIGGNGKGRTISLDITQYSNDEKIIPMNVTLGTDYKEGDILTLIKEISDSNINTTGGSISAGHSGTISVDTDPQTIFPVGSNVYLDESILLGTVTANTTSTITIGGGTLEDINNSDLYYVPDTSGTIQVMLVDIRFRLGHSYSLDISNIVKNNTVVDTSGIIYHNSNLQPLQTVDSSSGNGTGMIIATIEEPISLSTTTSNVLLLNQISYIFEIGQNYEVGDTISIRDRSGKSHKLTLVETSDNDSSSKNNIKEIFDTELLDGTKFLEPDYLSRSVTVSNNNLNIYDSISENTTAPNTRYNMDNTSDTIYERLSSVKNITGNKIHLHNSRFFNLGVYDNFYKGLLFEDITAGTTKRITHYDSTNNILTLENDMVNEHTSVQNFWKITNPSTSLKIFVPNGSDNPKDYINHIYEAIIYTGVINKLSDFITEDLVTIDNVVQKQYKINNKGFDNRIIHQYRTIVDYDVNSKMITLDRPLIGITSHANQFGRIDNNVIVGVKYIHIAGNNFQNTATGSAHYSLPVYPIELETYNTLSESPTNTNASGLTVDIVITNGTIASINDITIKQSGSGYESQNLSGTLYTTSSTGRNYITYV